MSDLIDRYAAIEALDVLCQEHRYKIPGKRETYSQYNEAWQDALDRAEGAIFNLPSAQPEPHEGHWIPVHPIQSDDPGAYMCSKCKTGMWEIRPSAYHYCPNCGAKMDEEPELPEDGKHEKRN